MAAFELAGGLADLLSELAIGPWQRAPEVPAFDPAPAAPAASVAESVWRVELTTDFAAGISALAAGERSLAYVHIALDQAPARFDCVLDQMLDDQARAAEQATSGAPVLVSAAALAAPAPANAIPGIGWQPLDWLERALQRVADALRGRACVETRVDGAIVAYSVLRLSGDAQLWVTPQLTKHVAHAHACSVAMAMRTRDAWMRIIALVVSCAIRLVTRGVLPTAAEALPLVWRFLCDLVRELGRLDNAT